MAFQHHAFGLGIGFRKGLEVETELKTRTSPRQPADFVAKDLLRQFLGVCLSDAKHAVESAAFSTQTDSVGVTQADGNSIDIDNESAKLAANALEHQAAVQVAHARIGILKAAMGTGA